MMIKDLKSPKARTLNFLDIGVLSEEQKEHKDEFENVLNELAL